MGYREEFEGMTIDGHEVDLTDLETSGIVRAGGEVYEASELLRDDYIMNQFDEMEIRDKEGLLKNIVEYLKEIEEEEKTDTRHSAAYYVRYRELVNRFRQEVEKRTFPEKMNDFWAYDYDVKETGITLKLILYYTPDLDRNGNIDSLTAESVFHILQVNAKLLTVEQYARDYGVTTTTVRQWIRRGKIRSAVKAGSEWRIPELAEVSSRGYQSGQYERTDYLSDLPEKYAFFNEYDFVRFDQDEKNRDLFDACFIKRIDITEYEGDIVCEETDLEHAEQKIRESDPEELHVRLDRKEREKFELYLISSPFVTASDTFLKHGR